MPLIANKTRLSDHTIDINTQQRSEESRAVYNLKVSN